MRTLTATLLIALSLVSAAVVAACSGPASPQFNTVLQFSVEVPPLPLVLSDETGLVTGIASAPRDPSGRYAGLSVRADPTDPNAFIVSWLGGACDSDATLTLSRHEGNYVLNVTIHGKFGFPGGCTANGIARDVRIVTSSPIPVESIIAAGAT
jgi:hypothetical protein